MSDLRPVEREECRVAHTMTQFYSHGTGTGGGSPLYPPDRDEDDSGQDVWDWGESEPDGSNFIPLSLPQHLTVMQPPTDVNLNIIRGPSSQTSTGTNS